MNKKQLQVNENIWKWLNQKKLDHNFRSTTDVLEVMITHIEDSIKKGDFEFTKQK